MYPSNELKKLLIFLINNEFIPFQTFLARERVILFVVIFVERRSNGTMEEWSGGIHSKKIEAHPSRLHLLVSVLNK